MSSWLPYSVAGSSRRASTCDRAGVPMGPAAAAAPGPAPALVPPPAPPTMMPAPPTPPPPPPTLPRESGLQQEVAAPRTPRWEYGSVPAIAAAAGPAAAVPTPGACCSSGAWPLGHSCAAATASMPEWFAAASPLQSGVTAAQAPPVTGTSAHRRGKPTSAAGEGAAAGGAGAGTTDTGLLHATPSEKAPPSCIWPVGTAAAGTAVAPATAASASGLRRNL